MNAILKINKIEDNNFIFQLQICNDNLEKLIIPISKLKRSGPQVGIRIFKGDELLDSISYMVISPLALDEEITLLQGESFEVEYKAILKKIGKIAYGLDFWQAMYLIEPGQPYSITFSLEGIVSDDIKYVFNI